jgi:ribosomal protein S12 methylthiotransferase
LKKIIGVVSLGCPKNLVDSEIMLGLINKENFEITNDESKAEIIIVNTCGFIESAKQESINTILEMAAHKKEKCQLLIVTGCLAQRYKGMIIKEIPEVDAVLGTGNYGEIVKIIDRAYKNEKPVLCSELNGVDYLKNDRILTNNTGSAYLKIAEGCDNCCTYCVIPSIRGIYRSRSIEDILREATYLTELGVKEIILVAQDTTRYGIDIYKESKLVDLIREISKIDKVEWVRLLYCYPEEIDDKLIEEMKNNVKICKYLDLPIQHSSNKILKLMGRRGSINEIEELLTNLRLKIPEIIIRTSLIVGFPNEDEQDFEELKDFVKAYEFDRLGVFKYSKEEGTPAFGMKNQVLKKVKNNRFNSIMSIQKKIAIKRNQNRLNKEYKVLVEGISEDGIFYFGRSYAEAPDIDGKIYFTSRKHLKPGDYADVKILNIDEYDLIGDDLDEPT